MEAGFTFAYDFDNDDTFEIETIDSASATVPASYLADGPGSLTVRGRIQDKDGDYTDYWTTIIIDNVAPTPAIEGPDSGVRGQPREFALSASDPSPIDTQAGFDYVVNWGDGSTSMVHGSPGYVLEHIYEQTGSYFIRVTAEDKDHGVSEVVEHAIVIHAIEMQNGTLAVGGTTGNDDLVVNPGGTPNEVQVLLNGQSGLYAGAGRIVAFGQRGDDHMRVAGGLTVPVELYGGAGNDDLTGGGGPSILVGGDGNDTIQGGVDRSLLIGGMGADVLMGLGGDDLLIADDFQRGSLFSIVQQSARDVLRRWSAPDLYADRVAALRADLIAMIFADDASDTLRGNGGLDWFLADLSGAFRDTVLGEIFSEQVTDTGR